MIEIEDLSNCEYIEDDGDDCIDINDLVNVPFTAKDISKKRKFPSNLLRCSIFSVIKKGEREYVEDMRITSLIEGYKILFTGKRLDQGDYDVFQTLVELWMHNGCQKYISFSSAEILELIGKKTKGNNPKLLFESILRIKRAEISIEFGELVYSGNLIHEIARTKDAKKWVVNINQKFAKLFEGHTTKIDFNIRKMLNGDFTKWLYNFYSTQSLDQKHSFEQIKTLVDSDLDDKYFAYNLRESLDQLKKLEVISGYSVDTKNRRILVFYKKSAKVEQMLEGNDEFVSLPSRSKKSTGRGRVAL